MPLSRKTSKKENILGAPKASEDSKVYLSLISSMPNPHHRFQIYTKVAPLRGPPKSVLQRIQKIAPRKHDDDNEPDPIDFLS